MPGPRKLVLMVEGDGDVLAAPILVKKMITQLGGWDVFSFDTADTMCVGHVSKLLKDEAVQ